MNRRFYKDLWALVAAVGLAGCSDLGAPLRLVPRAELSSSSLDFGTVVVNGTATRSVVVSNSGNADLKGFASVSCPAYSIQSGGGAFSVPPGGQHTVVVAYTPTAEGPSPCQLTLGGDIPPIAMTGAAALQAPGARCVLSVASLDFGATSVGGQPKLAFYVIRNPGTAALILNVVASCGDFVVLSGGGPSSLAAGDSLGVTVQFAPQASGLISCSIANGPGCPQMTVNGDGITVSFAGDIEPIFQLRGCVGCHFEFARQANQMVNVTSSGYAPAVRVKPFDLLNSVLYQKVTGTGRYGQAMPLGSGPLQPADANKIKAWILEGALNN
jgi:hypothetical protein